MTTQQSTTPTRRQFFGAATASVAAAAAAGAPGAAAGATVQAGASAIVRPPEARRLLLGVKLSMIAREEGGRQLTLIERLRLADRAGFDGVDFDEAGRFTEQEARDAVRESGVFVHNAINHDHWKLRLTSANAEERAKSRANLEHCLRLSHAAGGSGMLLVVGQGGDGPTDVIEERARQEIRAALPLAAALGQMILVENVWNRMMYDHDAAPEQGAERFVRFVDSFQSPWVGMYYDIGNHWKYGQPGEWVRSFAHRCVKLDIKGFSRRTDAFVDITSEQDDLPWDQVRRALQDIDFHGWATAEVDGGGLERLTLVRQQMEKALRST
jgi:hexulose-6-phosphate isomerase